MCKGCLELQVTGKQAVSKCNRLQVPTVVTLVGQDAAGNHERVSISPISPKGEVPKP